MYAAPGPKIKDTRLGGGITGFPDRHQYENAATVMHVAQHDQRVTLCGKPVSSLRRDARPWPPPHERHCAACLAAFPSTD